jgi:DNA-binding XRE family transcriptional regulator
MVNMSKILEHRKNAKMSQAELGKHLGVRQQTICNWENGISEPNLTQGLRLAEIFGVPVNDLAKPTTEVTA